MSKKPLQDLAGSSFVWLFVRTAWCALALGIAACAGTGQRADDVGATFASANSQTSVAAASANATDTGFGTKPNTQGAPDYLIGPQDLLKVEVFGVAAMNRSVRVNATGQIVLPMIGRIQAAGVTSEQLAAEIAARLAKDYLQNPQVIIFIEEYTSQRVTVIGAVRTSGVYPIKGRTTLLQAVASAGGPTTVANVRSVKIIRSEPDGRREAKDYDLTAIRDGRIADPEIRGEDVVLVDTSVAKDTAKQILEFVFPFMMVGTLL